MDAQTMKNTQGMSEDMIKLLKWIAKIKKAGAKTIDLDALVMRIGLLDLD